VQTVISGELLDNVTVYCLDRAVLLLVPPWHAYGNVLFGSENALWRPVCPMDSKGLAQWHITRRDMHNLWCMSMTSNPNHLLVAGSQSSMFLISRKGKWWSSFMEERIRLRSFVVVHKIEAIDTKPTIFDLHIAIFKRALFICLDQKCIINFYVCSIYSGHPHTICMGSTRLP